MYNIINIIIYIYLMTLHLILNACWRVNHLCNINVQTFAFDHRPCLGKNIVRTRLNMILQVTH